MNFRSTRMEKAGGEDKKGEGGKGVVFCFFSIYFAFARLHFRLLSALQAGQGRTRGGSCRRKARSTKGITVVSLQDVVKRCFESCRQCLLACKVRWSLRENCRSHNRHLNGLDPV